MDRCVTDRKERAVLEGGSAARKSSRGRLTAVLGMTLGLTLLSGCASDTRFVVGAEVSLEGRITEIDATPMFVDGDGVLVVETRRGREVTVLVPAREALCPARGLDVFHSLRAGDDVRAVGVALTSGSVRVCDERTHLLERADPVAKSVMRRGHAALAAGDVQGPIPTGSEPP